MGAVVGDEAIWGRRLVLVCMAAILAASLACAAPTPGRAGVSPAASEAKYGGTVKALVAYDLTDLDPTGPLRAVSTTLTPLVYNTLLGTAVGPDVQWGERNVVSELAERWEVSSDAKTYTFHLRKGVRFANLPPVNGRELTSQDVALSYQYWDRSGRFADQKLPASRSKYMFEGLDRIEAPDASTVVVRFKEPFAPFVSYVADDVVPVVPKELYDAPGGLPDNAIGSGPFQYDKAGTVTGSRVVFKKSAGFWQEGRPYLDEVHLLIIDGDAPQEAAFATRQLDVFPPKSDNSAENVKRIYPQGKLMEFLGARAANVRLNSRIPPLNDVRIRRAFAMGIDRDEIIKTLYAGKGEWALGGGPLGLFTNAEVRQILKYDPEAARRLVAEAGYPNGVDIEWIYPKSYGDLYDSRAQLIQAQMKKANINLRLKVTTETEFSQATRTTDQHQISAPGGSPLPDVGALLEQTYAAGAAQNVGGVNDPKLEALIKAERAEADPAKRREIIREAARYINADMIWGLSLLYEPGYVFWQPDMMNFYPSAWQGMQGTAIENVWRDR